MAKKKTKLEKWRDSVLMGIWSLMQDNKRLNERLDKLEEDITEIKKATQRLEAKP